MINVVPSIYDAVVEALAEEASEGRPASKELHEFSGEENIQDILRQAKNTPCHDLDAFSEWLGHRFLAFVVLQDQKKNGELSK